MTDEPDKTEDEAPEPDSSGPMAGQRLAEARRALQISLHEIAKELHLDEAKVRALEANDFDILGAPVFAKGHLRKYAQLVHVDTADVLADYYKLNRTSAVPPVVSSRPRPRQELSPGPWIVVIVVVVIAATAYWWFTSRPPETSAPAITSQQPQPVEETPVALPTDAEDSNDAAEDDDMIDDSASLEPAAVPERTAPQSAAPVAVVAAPGADVPTIAEGQVRLLVTYSGDCWTEITDATGRRLFFGLGNDGRTVELSGTAPLNALFGDADNVSLEVNGNDFTIPASSRRGDTARVVIAGN